VKHAFTNRAAYVLLIAILPLAMAANAAELTSGQAPKPKKFLTKPLVIEDQGSFFIGGVPKVTNYATVPGANQAAAPEQSPSALPALNFNSVPNSTTDHRPVRRQPNALHNHHHHFPN